MRIVIQRVTQASVNIGNETHASIGEGMLLLLGIVSDDTDEDVAWLVKKALGLRIFNDGDEIMNLSLKDISGEVLVISQFTLHASTKKGNRPSYMAAARPEVAIPLYERFISEMEKQMPDKVKTGSFGADMQVGLINNGPVTIIIDSKDRA